MLSFCDVLCDTANRLEINEETEGNCTLAPAVTGFLADGGEWGMAASVAETGSEGLGVVCGIV